MDRKFDTLILMALCLFFSIGNFIVLMQDNTYIAYEVQDSYTRTKIMYSEITGNNFTGITQETKDEFRTEYPPLPHIIAILFYFLFGVSEDIMAFSLILFLFILLFSTYWTGRALFNAKVSIISAVLIGFFPAVIGHSRNFISDFPELSLIALSYMCFFRTRQLNDWKWSIVLGIAIGFGFLTKLTFPLFLLPMIIIGLSWLKISFKEKVQRKFIRNLLVSGITAAIISLPWYLFNISNVVDGYIYDLTHYDSSYLSLSIQQRFFDYAFTIPWTYLLGKVFYLLVVLGIAYIFFNYNKKYISSGSKIVLLWLVVTILSLSMIGFYTHAIYELPVLIPASLILGIIFDRIFSIMQMKIRFLNRQFYAMLFTVLFFLLIYYLKVSQLAINSEFNYHSKFLETGLVTPHMINYSVDLVYTKIEKLSPSGITHNKMNVFVFSRQPPSVAICPYLLGKDISCFNYLECKENKNGAEARACESFFSGGYLEESLLNSDVIIVPLDPMDNKIVLINGQEEEKEAIAAAIIEKNFRPEASIKSYYENEFLGIFLRKNG